MKIREAIKKDLREYLELRRKNLKELFQITKGKIEISDKKIKKEFEDTFPNSNRFLLIAEENKKIIGYLIGTLFKNVWKKIGYIDDIFVIKKFRKKGVGNKLIKEFFEIIKSKKAKEISLGVHPKNKVALQFYKRLGFEINDYGMNKKLKCLNT